VLPREDVAQPHESDELEELCGCAAQPHPASVPVRRELQPCQRVDGDGIALDAVHVAEHGRLVGFPEQCAHASAEAREIGASDRAAYREADGARPWYGGHRLMDGRTAENSSLPEARKSC